MILSPEPQPTPPMETTPEDPHLASLKAIFPDFDDAVILSVLESTNNDHDRALDVLLGMNDPSFVPPNPPTQPPTQFQSAPSADAQRLSQEELDEQLARRLALEEQHAATAQTWQPQRMEGQTTYQPYQPRHGGRNGWGVQPPQPQGQGGRDTMADFQEGFNRIAESGKKTFSSIVSKVKAKMQEFDQGSGWSWPQNPPPGQSQLPAVASHSTYYAPTQQEASEQGRYTQPTNSQWPASQSQPVHSNTYTSSPPRSGVLLPAPADPPQSVSSQQPSFYDPNTRGYDLYDDEIEINDKRTSTTAVAMSATNTSQLPVTPLPADSSASPPPVSDTSSPPSYASRVSSPPSNPGLPSTSPPAQSLSPIITGARGTKPGTPGGVDFSKLGLLPKRPVSLVRSQSPPAAGAAASLGAPRVAAAHSTDTASSSTDHEEPEFVENPFEDR